MKFDRDHGTLSYSVFSRDNEIILPGRLGINTDAGDFSSEVKLKKTSIRIVDETMKREIIEVKTSSSLILDLLARGGFACRISLKD